MKKTILVLFCIALFLMVGCHEASTDTTANTTNTTNTTITNNNTTPQTTPKRNTPSAEPLTSHSLSVHSLEELDEMREMILCTDEERLQQYLISVEGIADTREDLIDFVSLIDSIPYLDLIQGEISWINHSCGTSEDTGKAYDFVMISAKKQNGEWIRFEYNLLLPDSTGGFKTEIGNLSPSVVLSQPIRSTQGDVTLFSEERKAHPTEKGTVITWCGSVDGIFTRIVYYTEKPDSVEAKALFSYISVSSVAKDNAGFE